MKKFLCIALLLTLFALGCSSGTTDATTPVAEPVRASSNSASHSPWGFWQGTIDPGAETIEFVQLRATDFHLNALPFLEPPPLLNLTLESLEFNGNIIEADIGLRHPFLGLTEFTGFDVCGIFIGNGSVTGFTDSGIAIPGEGDTRLLNADAYSRWWNPSEFDSNGTMFGYKDGLLGAPYSVGNFTGTVNGYKYFCDDLSGNNDPLTLVTQENRGMFSAGQKNVRHYTIDMSEGLIFNYAVDANWQFPNGAPPFAAPDDFSAEANRAEAWRIEVTETSNTLWNDGIGNGGALSLSIDVYDWYNADLNSVRVESPGNFTMVESATAVGGGSGYSTYEIDIPSATPPETSMDLLISIASEVPDFEGFIPGTNTTAYFTHTSDVETETPGGNYDLVIDNPKTFDTSLRDHKPCIAVNGSDVVYVMWIRVYYTPPTNTTTDYATSSDNGVSWDEPYWSVLGGFIDSDDNAASMDADGDIYFYGSSTANHPNDWSMIVRFNPAFSTSENSGLYLCGLEYGRAFNFTHDGYALAFGDRNNKISYKKCLTPNSCWSQGTWPGGWNSTPQYDAVSAPARLSKTDNIVRDSSNALYFVYFSSNASDTWVRMCRNTDGSGLNWTSTADIYNGASDGYDSVHDPCLYLDGSETFHSAFVAHDSSPVDSETILYTSSTDGENFTTPTEVVTVDGVGNLNEITIEEVTVGSDEILALFYLNGDNVYLTYSTDAGANWAAPTLIGAGDDGKPDMCSSSNGYLHMVWEHGQTGTDYAGTIEYKRGYFVEQ